MLTYCKHCHTSHTASVAQPRVTLFRLYCTQQGFQIAIAEHQLVFVTIDRLSRRHHVNTLLRTQKSGLVQQLKSFGIHLAKQQMLKKAQAQAEAQAQATKLAQAQTKATKQSSAPATMQQKTSQAKSEAQPKVAAQQPPKKQKRAVATQ